MLCEKLNGLRVELESLDRVEIFSFRQGSVSAVFGSKDGPLVAPILSCRITGDSSLVIDGVTPINWENIEFGLEAISVMRNGVKSMYKPT